MAKETLIKSVFAEFDDIKYLIFHHILDFQWEIQILGWRAAGVKGGRSPAQRTLEASSPPTREPMAGCSAVVHPTMETRAAVWARAIG